MAIGRSALRFRVLPAVAAATMGAVLFVAAAAFACTNHSGSWWVCANSFGSSGCLFAQRTLLGNLVNNTNYYFDGAALANGAATTHQFRWALTTDSEAACHTNGTVWTSAASDPSGNIVTSPKIYTGTSPGVGDGAAGPGAGSWQVCTTNNTGDHYAPHATITIT